MKFFSDASAAPGFIAHQAVTMKTLLSTGTRMAIGCFTHALDGIGLLVLMAFVPVFVRYRDSLWSR